VKPGLALADNIYSAQQYLVFFKRAVFHSFIQTDVVLLYNPADPDVQMAGFGVTRFSGLKPHCTA